MVPFSHSRKESPGHHLECAMMYIHFKSCRSKCIQDMTDDPGCMIVQQRSNVL